MNDQTENAVQAPRGCPVAHHGADLARLYGPEAATDPVGIYERLRKEHGSIAPVLLEGDVPAWLVLGYRDNRRVLDNPRQFSRDARIWRDWAEGRVEETSPLIPMLGWRPDCVSQDGEPHRRLRAAVTDGLQAAAVRGIRRHATHFANKQIDAFADAGRADLVKDYAEYLPMLVLSRILGLPEAEGRDLVESCAQVFKGGEDALAHNERIMVILGELAERKRSEPGGDFTTALLEHTAGLDEEEVVSHLRLVLIAAHTTTSNLLARVLQLVLTDTARLSGLISGQLNISAVVEEVMWNSPPLAVLPGRFAMRRPGTRWSPDPGGRPAAAGPRGGQPRPRRPAGYRCLGPGQPGASGVQFRSARVSRPEHRPVHHRDRRGRPAAPPAGPEPGRSAG